MANNETVRVYCEQDYQAATVAETLGGKLDLENNSVDLSIECPHEAEQLMREVLPATEYSVAKIS